MADVEAAGAAVEDVLLVVLVILEVVVDALVDAVVVLLVVRVLEVDLVVVAIVFVDVEVVFVVEGFEVVETTLVEVVLLMVLADVLVFRPRPLANGTVLVVETNAAPLAGAKLARFANLSEQYCCKQ